MEVDIKNHMLSLDIHNIHGQKHMVWPAGPPSLLAWAGPGCPSHGHIMWEKFPQRKPQLLRKPVDDKDEEELLWGDNILTERETD